MTDHDPDDMRLRKYFLHRAMKRLDEAKAETDPTMRLAIEHEAARYWSWASERGSSQ